MQKGLQKIDFKEKKSFSQIFQQNIMKTTYFSSFSSGFSKRGWFSSFSSKSENPVKLKQTFSPKLLLIQTGILKFLAQFHRHNLFGRFVSKQDIENLDQRYQIRKLLWPLRKFRLLAYNILKSKLRCRCFTAILLRFVRFVLPQNTSQ